ncbi:MAG: feruloyl-CoA synthase [Oricola sp.]
MNRRGNYQPHLVERKVRPDGAIILTSGRELGPVAGTTGDWLHRWAGEAPDRVFLAERSGTGWREERYGAALAKVRAVAAALVGRGLNADTPILVMSGNGVDHGLLVLAAQYAGIPAVPVAEQYALIPGAHDRLRHVIELVRPKLAYAVDADEYGEAIALEELAEVEIVASRPGSSRATPFDDLLRGDAGVDIDAVHAGVGPDTVAKILMTSGSTSHPKGVPTTHRMMCVNQTQMADALPFLRERPPVIVDWLPWNHVFGGSNNFNMMLANGGSLYIDDGKPVKGRFERTLENLSMVTGTLAFNVPVGFSMLLDALRADEGLRRRFFADLDLVFYAGASLPQDVWQGFEQMALEVSGSIPLMTSSWGLTETAPACLLQHEPTSSSGIVGVPLNGVSVKLIPDEEMRCEVRVKGPNIMSGYLRDPAKTAESFDEEGYFVTGDAMRFVDPERPEKGLRFDGRISEDFKLLTGTWVRAAALRLDLLCCLAPLAADLVVTGQDRDEIGALIFPNTDAIVAAGFAPRDDAGALVDEGLAAEIARRLAERAKTATGSSTRVTRALVMAEPASLGDGEMTAKGSLNARKVMSRRATLLERLYADGDPAAIRI